MPCIVPSCTNPATHNFGVRLRRPATTAIWSPNTAAHVCDEHATGGFVVAVLLTPTDTGQIETHVSSPGGPTVTRITPIIHEAQEDDPTSLFDE